MRRPLQASPPGPLPAPPQEAARHHPLLRTNKLRTRPGLPRPSELRAAEPAPDPLTRMMDSDSPAQGQWRAGSRASRTSRRRRRRRGQLRHRPRQRRPSLRGGPRGTRLQLCQADPYPSPSFSDSDDGLGKREDPVRRILRPASLGGSAPGRKIGRATLRQGQRPALRVAASAPPSRPVAGARATLQARDEVRGGVDSDNARGTHTRARAHTLTA